MKYLLLICGDESAAAHAEDGCGGWMEEMAERGALAASGGLRPPAEAKTIRVRRRQLLLSDGPFAETKEQIAGFCVIECSDLRGGDRGRRPPSGRGLRDDRDPAVPAMSTDVKAAVDAAFRDEWGRIVATLIRTTGDWDLAEECAQDAFAMALQRWPKDGIPGRPGAWLTTAARNRAIDVLRRKTVGAAKLREVAAMSYEPDPHGAYGAETDHSGVPDDRLRLMFTCCHPALSLEARVALTLRTLAGLTTAEIARAFLASEPTMAKRLTRAKQKIQHAGIPYRVPPAHLLPERMSAVLGVLYLLFNEGYSATAGANLVRQNLSAEAIRLVRVLARLMPDEPEVTGLLALMLLHDARRTARLDARGDLVTLEDQDRTKVECRPDR